MTKKQAAQAEAVEVLKSWGVAPLTVVYAKVTRVSASGMSRRVQLFIHHNNKGEPEIINISYWAAKAMGWGYKDGYNQGISVGGCGMDMLFHTVNSLSYAMGYGACRESITNEGKGGLIYKSL